jgi:hypothetical protein
VFDNFRTDALELARKSLITYNDRQQPIPFPFDIRNISGISLTYTYPTSYPIIHHTSYLEGLREIILKKKAEIKQNKDRYVFDVVVASQTADDGLAHVYYIDDNGAMNELFDTITIIGSDSAAMYGSVFTKPLSRPDMKINEFAELAYFTIKYIDRFKLDDTIGLEEQKPLVYIIPNHGDIGKAQDCLIDTWESNSNKMLANFEEYGIHKLL